MTEYDEAMDRFKQAVSDMVQTMAEYDEAMDRFKQAVSDTVQTMAEKLQPVLKAWMGGFTYYCKYYGNSRVVHLALHAKKARVRNKNRNRLINDYLTALQRGVVQ